MLSELEVEMLVRRAVVKKGAAWDGEVPERPRVVMDMRLLPDAAVEIGVGSDGVPAVALGTLGVRAKMLPRVLVIEPRRGREPPESCGSSDMMLNKSKV